jgi:hypothetical protein
MEMEQTMMTEEEILDLPVEPDDMESELRDLVKKADKALREAEDGKSHMEPDRCRSCEAAHDAVDLATDALYNMDADIDSCADNLVEWQEWGAAWKEEALSLIKKYEPDRLEDDSGAVSATATTTSSSSSSSSSSMPSKDLARLNKEPGRTTCASCGGYLKEPWTGLKHCPVCEP